MKIIFFIIILIILFFIVYEIRFEKEAKKGLQKIVDLGTDLTEAETSNLTLKQNEIYTEWCYEIKKEYDKIEISKSGWNQNKYDMIFKKTYPKIDHLIMSKYNIDQNEFEKIIDIGDVISAKEISKIEIEMSNRVGEIKKGDVKSKIQVAREYNTTFYEVDEAMKKSIINLTLDFFNNDN